MSRYNSEYNKYQKYLRSLDINSLIAEAFERHADYCTNDRAWQYDAARCALEYRVSALEECSCDNY